MRTEVIEKLEELTERYAAQKQWIAERKLRLQEIKRAHAALDAESREIERELAENGHGTGLAEIQEKVVALVLSCPPDEAEVPLQTEE